MAWSNRQSPAGDNVFLDHVGWFVRSLDAVKPAFERLGFIVSTENVHMNQAPDGSQAPTGTRNRLATPGLGYLEFLAASGDTPIARQHGAQLAQQPLAQELQGPSCFQALLIGHSLQR